MPPGTSKTRGQIQGVVREDERALLTSSRDICAWQQLSR